jgi:hypothetical protein
LLGLWIPACFTLGKLLFQSFDTMLSGRQELQIENIVAFGIINTVKVGSLPWINIPKLSQSWNRPRKILVIRHPQHDIFVAGVPFILVSCPGKNPTPLDFGQTFGAPLGTVGIDLETVLAISGQSILRKVVQMEIQGALIVQTLTAYF